MLVGGYLMEHTGNNPSITLCLLRYGASISCFVKLLPGTGRSICYTLYWQIVNSNVIEHTI